MEKIRVQKYMNPITFEAEMFVNSLESLCKTYNNIDAELVSSLEKVMNAIETFLDTSQSEVLATEQTKLVACNVQDIKRIYHCSKCKTDLGKSPEKVTLHLIDSCAPHLSTLQRSDSNSMAQSNTKNELKEKNSKKSIFEKRKAEKKLKRNKRVYQAVKLTKKTVALLTSNYEQFLIDHDKIGDKLKCLPVYDTIERDLISTISPLFPNQKVKVYKFGSRLAGIGTRESDLDIFVDIGSTFNNFQHRADSETLVKLHKVGNALNKSRKTWTGLVTIDKARVPILRIIHVDSSIECDINFSNSLGIVNTQFLDYIFTLQPIARLLCIFMKKWLKRTGLNDEFNTYSIILMVIFYLQSSKILPSMERLQQNINKEKALNVGPWLCSYETASLKDLEISLQNLSNDNMLTLIEGFFQFYVSFNFDHIICPYLGMPVKRTEFDSLMPERYTNYVKEFGDYALNVDSAMVVQDPIQLNHNVTTGAAPLTFEVFTTFMAKSLEVIHDAFIF